MNGSLLRLRRSLVALALGGSTFWLFGTTFAPHGCATALNADYAALFQAVGEAAIDKVSDDLLGNIGTDYDAFVRVPTTAFAKSVWANWLDTRIPDDLPNNAVVAR